MESAGSMERRDWAAVERQGKRNWWHWGDGEGWVRGCGPWERWGYWEHWGYWETTDPSMPRAPRSAHSAAPRVPSLIGCSVAALPPASVIGGWTSGTANGEKGAGPARPGGGKFGAGVHLAREGWWRWRGDPGGPGGDLGGLGSFLGRHEGQRWGPAQRGWD